MNFYKSLVHQEQVLDHFERHVKVQSIIVDTTNAESGDYSVSNKTCNLNE